jgi:hypothetical protein
MFWSSETFIINNNKCYDKYNKHIDENMSVKYMDLCYNTPTSIEDIKIKLPNYTCGGTNLHVALENIPRQWLENRKDIYIMTDGEV